MENIIRLPATHMYVWAGTERHYICEGHLPTLESITNAMGYDLLIEPIGDDDFQLCGQKGPSCPIGEELAKSLEHLAEKLGIKDA